MADPSSEKRSSPTRGLTGGDIVAKWLKDNSITHAFGIIGAGNAAIYDAILRLGYTHVVATHHEQAAVMAASTYVRTSGRISVAIVTTGAGSSNAITGLISGHMDSIPTMVIAGNERSKEFTAMGGTGTEMGPQRTYGVQGYDSIAVAKPVCKDVWRITHPVFIMSSLNQALIVAKHDRPGAVWIDIPMDIQNCSVQLL